MSRAAEALGPGGAVSQVLPHFHPRSAQQAMAEAVEDAIADSKVLVCEAGTGTGKTFAYLVPAVLSGKRILISTGTKHLQDQLYQRDLPTLRKALGRPVRVALLKGRANYLCWHRLGASAERRLDRRAMGERLVVHQWAGQTQVGDIAELSRLPESAAVWPSVTSTADNCLGTQCHYYDDCFVLKARRRALEADVVVVNHHLLFADLALREGGFGELLPSVDAVVLDEAHQVPAIATQFFGESVSTRQLGHLVADTLDAQAAQAPDALDIAELGARVNEASEQLRGAAGPPDQRLAWRTVARRLEREVETLDEALGVFSEACVSLSERGPTLASCAERSRAARAKLRGLWHSDDDEGVLWLETHRRSVTWHWSPLEIGPQLKAHLQSEARAWIFTSATLSVAGTCAHFAERAGLPHYDELCLPSPFDFETQCLGYLPKQLPEPRAADFHERLAEAVLPVIKAAGGRTFLLFTSYRGMAACLERLRSVLDYPLLVQGDMPRAELLNQFRRLGNAVLFGTSSFWQGVDVQGEALSCVIIDKLPFEPPGDPVLAARMEKMRREGQDPFSGHQVPQAVIALKQGIGRLIRGESDRGVLVFGDIRLLERPYGAVFIDSMPSMEITRRLADVEAFFLQTGVSA